MMTENWNREIEENIAGIRASLEATKVHPRTVDWIMDAIYQRLMRERKVKSCP